MTDAIKTNSASPFDNLSALRLDQSYADTVGVKKLLTTVPVRKPNRQEFVRVHPDPAYRLTPAAIIEVRRSRGVFGYARHGTDPPWRVLDSNAAHHDQSSGHIAHLAS